MSGRKNTSAMGQARASALRLVKYMACPSTVRAALSFQFGKAGPFPPREEIERMRRDHLRLRASNRRINPGKNTPTNGEHDHG